MMDTVIISLVSAIFSGGLVGVITNFILKKKEQQSKDYTNLIDRLEQENLRLVAENEKKRKNEEQTRKKIQSLERDIFNLKNKLQLLQNLQLSLPLPQWAKGKDGVMISFNKAFENEFILPNKRDPMTYIGSTCVDFWRHEFAEEYCEHDREVLKLKNPKHFVEQFKNPKGMVNWEIYKYPLYSGNLIIGVGGIAYRPVKI